MTRAKRPILALIISFLSFISAGVIIGLVSPSHWLIELGVLVLVAIGIWLGSSWLIGKRKWAAILVIFLMVSFLLSRWGILNWITFGLWVAIIGLISLIN
ncbi:MAG: hypothetical protein Q7S31_01765 [bacterium]|nr:hypothetical protein [bacterium]